MVQSAILKAPRLTALTTVEDISWKRTVMIGTAMRDQTMKNGLPMFDLGVMSPYLFSRQSLIS